MSSPPLPQPVAAYLDRRGLENSRVVALTGDASDRQYFRVMPPAAESFVLARYPDPYTPGSLPFVRVAELLAAMPLPIPRIRDEAPDLGVVTLDDLGDVTLQAHVDSVPTERDLPLYERAIAHLAVLQQRGRQLADPRYPPYALAFDREKLMWEMDFFLRHFVEDFRGQPLESAARDSIRGQLAGVVEELAAEPRVLCHRDYHSRNLMVHGDDLFIIDFQDARMGPDTYDLVSLLRDSYVGMPASMADELVVQFRRQAAIADDAAAFERRFDLMALQRNLKALGTFGYQAAVRGNRSYAQYVPRTAAYVRDTLAKQSARLSELRRLFARYIPELA